MFGFLKRRKAERDARDKIGIELHRQIKEAFEQNEQETSVRLSTFFTAGYTYGFVRIGFAHITGVSGECATDKHIRHICDGVMPNKLYEILDQKLKELEIARRTDGKIPGSKVSRSEAIKLFEIGAEMGMSDTECFNYFFGSKANNLTKFLVGELDDLPLLK